MLPFCDRHVRVSRDKYLPSHNRGIPVPKQPQTIGGHLRKRRLQLKILQSDAAHRLGVSTVSMSKWERDKIYPSWPHQPRIVEYLGNDPFTDPALGRPKGNETKAVAFLSQTAPDSIASSLRKHRLALRKNQKEFAKELRVEARTLRDWEAGRHRPCHRLRELLLTILKAR